MLRPTLILAIVALLPDVARAAAILEVKAEAANAGTLPRWFQIEAVRVGGTGTVLKSFMSGRADSANDLDVQPGVWRVLVRATGLWSPQQVVTIEDPKERRAVLFKMWPAGRLVARVEGVPEGSSLEVAFESPPEHRPRGISRNTVTCPIREGGWSCEVPAVALDLEFHVKGFIRQHRFGVIVPAGQPLDLGLLSFRQGASIEGIVTTADGSRARAGRVRLKTGFGDPVSATVPPGRPLEGALNQRGFYQLVDLPEGRFVLEAEQAGWANTAAPVTVESNTQMKVPPLVLARPETLELRLNPPLDPARKPWTVGLLDTRSGFLAVGHLRAARGGVWREQGLGAGRYIVNIEASDGDRWLSHEVDVPHPGPVHLEIDMVELVGTIRLGRAPLKAQLQFGGAHGATRIALDSDEEGRFRGRIPRREPGRDWEVHVTAEDPPVRRTLRHVRPEPGGGDYVFELAIPDVRLRGKVVDDQGTPQAGYVNAQSIDEPERMVQVRTGSDGYFDVVGLPPGRAVVLFQGRGRSSSMIDVKLHEEEPTRIDLTARPFVMVKGRVVGPEGDGVARARVQAHPGHLPKWWGPSETTSRADGSFEVGVPHDSTRVTLTAGAVGFTLTSVQLPASAAGTVVTLARYGGTLQLTYPRTVSMDFPTTPAAYLVTALDYELLENPLLQGWAQANLIFSDEVSPAARPRPVGDPGISTLTLPQMAPGRYSLCLLRMVEHLEMVKGRVPWKQCVSGTLSAGGMLPLQIGAEPSS